MRLQAACLQDSFGRSAKMMQNMCVYTKKRFRVDGPWKRHKTTKNKSPVILCICSHLGFFVVVFGLFAAVFVSLCIRFASPRCLFASPCGCFVSLFAWLFLYGRYICTCFQSLKLLQNNSIEYNHNHQTAKQSKPKNWNSFKKPFFFIKKQVVWFYLAL